MKSKIINLIVLSIVLCLFEIKVNAQNNVFTIDGNQRFKNMDYTVEGDCSNAAFLEAFNYLGGNVGVKGLKF